MGKWCMKESLKQQRNLTPNIAFGGCGSVYKVELQLGQVFAVKKLHSMQDSRIANAKAFKNEIRAQLETKHRNLVKLYDFCSHP